jgi:hypothetical protein
MTMNWMILAALAAMAYIYVYEPSISARSITFVHSQLLKTPRPNASPPIASYFDSTLQLVTSR